MKKNNKRIIIGVISVIVLAVVIITVGKSLADPSSGYLKNQKIDGLSFENASIEYKNDLSTFTVDVYNENNKTIKIENINIILKNDDDKTITLIDDSLGSLESNEGRKLIIEGIDYDLSSYNKVEYKINK